MCHVQIFGFQDRFSQSNPGVAQVNTGFRKCPDMSMIEFKHHSRTVHEVLGVEQMLFVDTFLEAILRMRILGSV